MKSVFHRCAVGLGVAAMFVVPAPVQGEVVEEIVAWINGDIITLSDLNESEQMRLADVYRQQTGEELDQQVKELQENLLLDMIDHKILMDNFELLPYDFTGLGDFLFKNFVEQQGIASTEELERMLAKEGMTPDDFKQQLIEVFAPEEVIRFEVSKRISVSNSEIEAYYQTHSDEFFVPGNVSFREIVLLAEGEEQKAERRKEVASVIARVRAGEDFGDLAEEVSEAGTRSSGGLIGPLAKGELATQLEELAFSISIGEVSEPLETAYGFHILKVVSRSEDSSRSSEDVREEIRAKLENDKYFAELQTFMERARSEAEWCVKPRFRDRLTIESPECPQL